jgi:hypothetical protein
MISVIYRAGLYVSSFSPLYILLALGNYAHINSFKKILDILKFKSMAGSIFWITIILLIFISFVTLLFIMKRKLNEKHQFRDVVKTEDNILNYVVTYLVPLLSVDITKTNSLIVNAGLFLLLGFIYVKNKLVYLNPLFLFFGFNIFKTASGDILISNFDIYELKNFENEKLKCRVLSYKLYLVRK